MQIGDRCPVCGGGSFTSKDVLWNELVDTWQLAPFEVDYINHQQGFACDTCGNNLRSMGLAKAVLNEFAFRGTLSDFCGGETKLGILEINRSGNLTAFLAKASGHRLIEYPDFDMQSLALESETYDLIVHSDTLEHVPDPIKGLGECLRVLKPGGCCIFTIPIIVDRFSRGRRGLVPSYHGNPTEDGLDWLVHTEFGADAWKFVIRAGFNRCEIYAYEYPAALVLIARK